jgi:hypothetical protein
VFEFIYASASQPVHCSRKPTKGYHQPHTPPRANKRKTNGDTGDKIQTGSIQGLKRSINRTPPIVNELDYSTNPPTVGIVGFEDTPHYPWWYEYMLCQAQGKHWQSPPRLYKKRGLEAEQMVQAIIFKHGRGRVAKEPVDCFHRNKFTPCILLTSRVRRSYALHKSESLPPARHNPPQPAKAYLQLKFACQKLAN